MKLIVLTILCLAALACAVDKYDIDDIDLSEVLGNDRLLKSYTKCLLNKGPCTPEVKNLKGNIRRLLTTRNKLNNYELTVGAGRSSARGRRGGPCITGSVSKAVSIDIIDKLPEVLQTRCAKCTDKQKQMGRQLIQELRSKHPEIWSQLASFYDPEGKFKQSLEEFLKSQ